MAKLFLLMIDYFFIFLIYNYQIFISPILGSNCRFKITCSQYAVKSIKKLGIFWGTYVACKRLLKCHPYNLKK